MQLERRAGPEEVLDRRPARAVGRVVQHQVALAEGTALGILAGESDRRPLGQQRRVRQRLGVRPVDSPRGDQPVAPPLELFLQLRVHCEAVRHREQLRVQLPEQVRRDRRLRFRRHLMGDSLRLLAATAPSSPRRQARLQRLLGLRESLVGGLGLGCGGRRVQHSLAC